MNISLQARLETFVERVPECGCWVWNGALTNNGYARLKVAGKTRVAHVVAYELHAGPVPDGLQLDHLCRVRCCVNPAHLEPVAARVNVLRGETITAANAVKTHCKREHPLDGDNLFVRNDGRRRCRICEREAQKKVKQNPIYKAKHAARERARRLKEKGNA